MDAFLAKKKGLITRGDCTLNGTCQSSVISHTQVFRAVNEPLKGTPSQGPLMENNATQSKATNPNKGIPEPSNVSSISITSNLPAAEPPSLDAVDYCNDPSSCTTNQYREQEATAPLSSPIANRTRKQCATLKQHRATCDCELVPTPLPLSEITLPEAIHNVTKYHADYFRCEDGESET